MQAGVRAEKMLGVTYSDKGNRADKFACLVKYYAV